VTLRRYRRRGADAITRLLLVRPSFHCARELLAATKRQYISGIFFHPSERMNAGLEAASLVRAARRGTAVRMLDLYHRENSPRPASIIRSSAQTAPTGNC
jgi:hypothetical protein